MKHLAVLALVFSAYLVPTYADAIFTPGNNPQPGEENVLFNNNMSSSTITGVTNQTGTTVLLSSPGNTLVTTANGQANLTGSTGVITDLTISLLGGGTFSGLILHPMIDPKMMTGATTITANMSDGKSQNFAYNGDVQIGQNFVTITANGGDFLKSVTITSAAGFTSLDQVRISGIGSASPIPSSAAPEPASMVLMGAGLLILVPVMRRRNRA